jgi:hypothetical protein
MSLLDALLLDPYRINIWIAYRSDSVKGSGSQNDPYDGSTAAKLDALLSGLDENTCVHLGPGTFETAGYYDGLSGLGWQPKSGLRIVGSGIDVTTLKLVNSGATTQRVYAIAHALSSATVDFFEASDMTIDCNYVPTQGTSWTAGAVRVMGNHSRVVRLKVINWGNKSTSTEGFVIAMLTGDPVSGVTGVANCGIEECIAVEPHASAAGKITVLHVGGKETAGGSDEAFGIGSYIRNCYVDCGQTSDFSKDYRALSIAWCRDGIVEGNQVHNTKHGGPYQTASGARGVTVRNNAYRNVYKGPYWSNDTQGVQQLLIEGNRIELATVAPSTEHGIQINSTITPPPYIYGSIIVRDNQIRYVDGDSGNAGGIRIYEAVNLQVRENVLELSATNPLSDKNCADVEYFDNRKPDGTLIQGIDESNNNKKYDELESDAEDALVMALLNNK